MRKLLLALIVLGCMAPGCCCPFCETPPKPPTELDESPADVEPSVPTDD